MTEKRGLARPRATAGRRATASPSYEIAVLGRALDLLELLGEQSGLTLTELAQQARLNKVTVFRILVNLVRRGYMQRDKASGRYRLGLKLMQLSSRLTDGLDVRSVARHVLEALQKRFDETVNLAVTIDDRIAYIDILESARSLRMAATVGSTDGLHSTALGKATLAQQSEQAVLQFVRRCGLSRKTSKTIRDRHRLLTELRKIRQRGYAIDDEENEEGARCVGAPIFDHDGSVVAAISISGPASRITSERIAELGAAVSEASRAISERLGYQRVGGAEGRVRGLTASGAER
jgi:DNA-binding IclR family transcriptional regulator